MIKYLQNFPNSRLRRNRQSEWIRNLVSENSLSVNDLIWPVFICDGINIKEEVISMPGVYRYSIDRLNEVTDQAVDNKINLIALFPNTPNEKKDKNGREALNEDNLVCKALKKIKDQSLNLGIMCDVALDPYTSHGHDGLLSDTNQILNDESNEILVKQSLLLADHKADIIAPSDMMDGRIGLIRSALEDNNFKDTLLLSYAAKYASSFYGPFRDAVGSGNNLKSDKKTYQMDYANSDEALRETALDISEGADIIMVKPGIDVIQKLKKEFKFPTFAYQVSGEYAMVKAAAANGWIDEEKIILEQLTSFKRAGADAILTYFALNVAKKINLIS
jgi:porphobilinogen synthase